MLYSPLQGGVTKNKGRGYHKIKCVEYETFELVCMRVHV